MAKETAVATEGNLFVAWIQAARDGLAKAAFDVPGAKPKTVVLAAVTSICCVAYLSVTCGELSSFATSTPVDPHANQGPLLAPMEMGTKFVS